MKSKLLILSLISATIFAQKPGYYNGTEGLKGDELKTALHEIINDHIDISYNDAKYIINYAQEDPANSKNLIQFYTNRSVSKDDYGTGGDTHNREHVWAKSHGDFADMRPMDGDAHNLHAADGSVNVTRSNYDFDNVTDGKYIEEADAYYSSGDRIFEPADRDKGEVARTLMYMAVRYEGTNGELDLELVDGSSISPRPEHGNLSTLLEWNRDFPPTDFERRRNDRVEQCQGNRNPFVDNPAFADLIWGTAEPSPINVDEVVMSPKFPKAEEEITISMKAENIQSAKIMWGKSYANINNPASFVDNGDNNYSVKFTPTGIAAYSTIYCKLITADEAKADTAFFTFILDGDNTPISIASVQGTGNASPMVNQNVVISGVVTVNFDNTYCIQDGNNPRDAMTIYSLFRGQLGDSVKVIGKVVEYNNLTEITNVTAVYNYGQVGEKEPQVITITDINEDYEGVLVELKNVSFDEGGSNFPSGDTYPYPTFTVSDGANDLTFFARYDSRLCNMPIPSGIINVKGVIGQYQDNYQIMSNDTSWFTPATDNIPPKIVSIELEDRTDKRVWMLVNFNEIVMEDDIENEDNFSLSEGAKIVRSYYNSSKPNQAKIMIENVKKGDYTLTVSNIKDSFGNTLNGSTTFTSNIDKPTGIKDNEVDAFVSIYPNPVSGEKVLITSQENISSLSVFSMDGQIILAPKEINQTEYNLDVTGFNTGIYLIQMNLGKNIVSKRLVIN